MSKFIEFFGDDEKSNKSNEELAMEEYNYIKEKDSWGGFHIIEISSILFNISIRIYVDNGNNVYNRYSYSENLKDNVPLMLLSYHNNNNFDLLYDRDIQLNLEGIKQKKNIIINQSISKNLVNYTGEQFNNKYSLTKYKGNEYIYDDISKYLKSKDKHKIKQIL